MHKPRAHCSAYARQILKVKHQRVAKRPVRIARRGMHDHSDRLVYNGNIRILIHNVYRNILRNKLRRHGRRKLNFNNITHAHGILCFFGTTVDRYRTAKKQPLHRRTRKLRVFRGKSIQPASVFLCRNNNFSAVSTAGAVVSGAYLGDKMSPMSDTTNLAPAVAEADLFDHIKSMMYTTGPAFVITLIVYGLLGLQYDASSVDSEMVTMMTAAIQENFHMNILLLLPAVAVIVMAVCKCPSIPTLMVSTLVAVVLAMLVQGQSLSGILNILDSGFSIDTALPEFNRLVNRGGLQSMLWTAALGILGMLYGSIMEKAGLLEALLSKMAPLVKSTGGLVTAVVLTCTLLLMATASQTLAIVVGGRMYIGEFKKKNLLPQTLSRTLEDSGTIISPLVPWSLCGAYMAGTLGVSTMSYLPFTMFCWLCPVLAIVYGFTGKFFWKTGEKSSQKIYQFSTLIEAS